MTRIVNFVAYSGFVCEDKQLKSICIHRKALKFANGKGENKSRVGSNMGTCSSQYS